MTPRINCTHMLPAGHIAPTTWVRRVVRRLQAAQILYKQRNALAKLDDALLRDIGVTREQANSEALRPVWDGPNHWRRS